MTAIRTFQGDTPETSDVVLCHYCGESLHDPEHDVEWNRDAKHHLCKPMLKVQVAELEALLLRAVDDIEKGWLAIDGVEEKYNTDGSWHVVQDIREALKEAK
jgi:hypothetical protein